MSKNTEILFCVECGDPLWESRKKYDDLCERCWWTREDERVNQANGTTEHQEKTRN